MKGYGFINSRLSSLTCLIAFVFAVMDTAYGTEVNYTLNYKEPVEAVVQVRITEEGYITSCQGGPGACQYESKEFKWGNGKTSALHRARKSSVGVALDSIGSVMYLGLKDNQSYYPTKDEFVPENCIGRSIKVGEGAVLGGGLIDKTTRKDVFFCPDKIIFKEYTSLSALWRSNKVNEEIYEQRVNPTKEREIIVINGSVSTEPYKDEDSNIYRDSEFFSWWLNEFYERDLKPFDGEKSVKAESVDADWAADLQD